MYEWLLSLKQPDGSFVVHLGGEVDVRASYCVLCISLLLGICTPELIEGMQDFIAKCQTFEGGLAASAFFDEGADGSAALEAANPALGEAHGGYAHCALASYLTLMRLNEGSSSTSKGERKLDLQRCLRWAVSQQGIAIEGGAFRGRTNKLVDGCYGWFSGGGMFAVLDAALILEAQAACATAAGGAPASPPRAATNGHAQHEQTAYAQSDSSGSSSAWVSESSEEAEAPANNVGNGTNPAAAKRRRAAVGDEYLYDRASLQEYILAVAQVKTGGLRDKPGKRPDAYHTCYNLSGLSLAQHRLVPCAESLQAFKQTWRGFADADAEAAQAADRWRAHCYAATLSWREEAEQLLHVGRKEDLVTPTHPVLNIAFIRAKLMMDHFYGQGP